MAFIPATINVDKKNPNGGRQTHLMTCSEDGLINIWDTRNVDKETLKKDLLKAQSTGKFMEKAWIPMRLEVFKYDQTGELGLSRILLKKNQTDAQFWGASDEGDLCLIDWSIRAPGGQNDDAPKVTEYVKFCYDSEKEYRPALALERSKFYQNLLLTVHDFHFAIWKIDLEEYEKPIFRSVTCSNQAHNTCGAFSPTRPGVIFITKTDGIDVWDFLDQSNKPSLTLSFATSVITYMKF